MLLYNKKKVLFTLFIVLLANRAVAEIYYYVNDSGRKIYVDRLSQIPNKFRKDIEQRSIKVTENSKSEQAAFDRETKRLEQKLVVNNVIARLKQSQKAIRSPVKISKNQVVVPVAISQGSKDYELRLLLDTGANVTVIHSDSLPFFENEHVKSSYAKIANGSLIKTWNLTLEDLRFGPYSNPYHRVTVIEHEGASAYDGLLGMDLLAQTAYQIDFAKQEMVWDQQKLIDIQEEIELLELKLRE